MCALLTISILIFFLLVSVFDFLDKDKRAIWWRRNPDVTAIVTKVLGVPIMTVFFSGGRY